MIKIKNRNDLIKFCDTKYISQLILFQSSIKTSDYLSLIPGSLQSSSLILSKCNPRAVLHTVCLRLLGLTMYRLLIGGKIGPVLLFVPRDRHKHTFLHEKDYFR